MAEEAKKEDVKIEVINEGDKEKQNEIAVQNLEDGYQDDAKADDHEEEKILTEEEKQALVRRKTIDAYWKKKTEKTL